MSTRLITPPERLPVTVGDVHAHARITTSDQDQLLYLWIGQATALAQHLTGRQLLTATWEDVYDRWPCGTDSRGDLALQLSWAPVKSVSFVKYFDAAGIEQTLDLAAYRLDAVSLRPRIVFAPNANLPGLADRSQAVTVRYVAGYGTEPKYVPEAVRHWILIQVATGDAFREAFTDRSSYSVPSRFVDGLLDPYIVPGWR